MARLDVEDVSPGRVGRRPHARPLNRAAEMWLRSVKAETLRTRISSSAFRRLDSGINNWNIRLFGCGVM
jgi:hypothetical protein